VVAAAAVVVVAVVVAAATATTGNPALNLHNQLHGAPSSAMGLLFWFGFWFWFWVLVEFWVGSRAETAPVRVKNG
jgi:hypothetical protein